MKKSIVVYAHIVFWIIFVATRFLSPLLGRNYLPVSEIGLITVVVTFLTPLFFYIGYLFVMKINWRSKSLKIVVPAVLLIYLVLFLVSKKAFVYAISPLSAFFLWTTFGGLFRYFIDWFKKRNDVLTLEKENAASNLAVLKSQINPHFLYNTLHNIDTLIYVDRDKASKSLEKLSDIMRYMLSDTQSEFVDLQKELDYLSNYLALEQLRLKSERFLSYNVSGDCNGLKIAPMVLIPFVENAFKHSVDSGVEKGIEINISIIKSRLSFVCLNRFDQSYTDKDKGHGIGLDNVKKRLSLIYGDRYNLAIDTADSVFIVNLTIELNEN